MTPHQPRSVQRLLIPLRPAFLPAKTLILALLKAPLIESVQAELLAILLLANLTDPCRLIRLPLVAAILLLLVIAPLAGFLPLALLLVRRAGLDALPLGPLFGLILAFLLAAAAPLIVLVRLRKARLEALPSILPLLVARLDRRVLLLAMLPLLIARLARMVLLLAMLPLVLLLVRQACFEAPGLTLAFPLAADRLRMALLDALPLF